MNTPEMNFARQASADDFSAIVQLLRSEHLPTEDIKPDLSHFFVVENAGQIMGVIGLELYQQDGLLRSLVVHQNNRNRSVAKILMNALLPYAADKDVRNLYLMTTTAEMYFAANGFSVIDRKNVPSGILSTAEFTTLCPSTATVMKRNL